MANGRVTYQDIVDSIRSVARDLSKIRLDELTPEGLARDEARPSNHYLKGVAHKKMESAEGYLRALALAAEETAAAIEVEERQRREDRPRWAPPTAAPVGPWKVSVLRLGETWVTRITRGVQTFTIASADGDDAEEHCRGIAAMFEQAVAAT